MKKFDVAIVGGGIIGCSIAFELAARKMSVVLLDQREPGREASWAAAGMLSPAPDSPRDVPLVDLSRESLGLYPEFIRAIEKESGDTVSYRRDGTLQIFTNENAEAERDAMASAHHALGLPAEPVALGEARRMEPALGPAARATLLLPDEGTVDPRLLMQAVLAAARNGGVEIRSGCAVTSLLMKGDRCHGVVAGGRSICAQHTVIAAGCFSGKIAGGTAALAISIPTRPVRGQMLAMRRSGLILRRTLRSTHSYLVPRLDGRLVAGSTLEDAGFDKSVTPRGMRQIIEGALELCPELEGAEILESWAGLRPGTPDDLPVLGSPGIDGLIFATGHYRNGILLAPITAKLVSEWIIHGHAKFDTKTFSPLRFREAATGSFPPNDGSGVVGQ